MIQDTTPQQQLAVPDNRLSRGWRPGLRRWSTATTARPGSLERVSAANRPTTWCACAASICRAWAFPTTPARKRADPTISSRVSRSISSLRSWGRQFAQHAPAFPVTGPPPSRSPKVRRQMTGARRPLDRAWSRGISRPRGARGAAAAHGFLDVDQAQIVFLAAANSGQHREAESAKRAAPLHPVGGIQNLDGALVLPTTAGK